MSNNPTSSDGTQASLESLKLRPGSFLQIHNSAKEKAICEVKLLRVVKEKGVMVGLTGDSTKQGLVTGKDYEIRGFSGLHDFSFTAQVMQIFQEPIAYAILSYPEFVLSNAIRKAVRTKTTLLAKVNPQGKSQSFDVTLTDLNIGGAKLESALRIGPPGDLVNLSFTVDFEQSKMDMNLLSTIRYTIKSESGVGYSIGVEFNETTRDDKLVLHYVASQENDTSSSDVDI